MKRDLFTFIFLKNKRIHRFVDNIHDIIINGLRCCYE